MDKIPEANRAERLRAKIELSKSGYAGVDKKGNIVDRRDSDSHNAVPVQENKMMGIPAPKKVFNMNMGRAM